MDKLAEVEMTWGERLRAEGRVEGRVEGEQKMLLRLLALMFGEISESITTRINAITDEDVLTNLAQQILTIHSLDELKLPDKDESVGN